MLQDFLRALLDLSAYVVLPAVYRELFGNLTDKVRRQRCIALNFAKYRGSASTRRRFLSFQHPVVHSVEHHRRPRENLGQAGGGFPRRVYGQIDAATGKKAGAGARDR